MHGSNEGQYQPIAVNPAGLLVFLPLVTPEDKSAMTTMAKNGDTNMPFTLTNYSPAHLVSPFGAEMYACYAAVADGSHAYQIHAKYPIGQDLSTCAKLQLNTTVQAYTVPVAEYYY